MPGWGRGSRSAGPLSRLPRPPGSCSPPRARSTRTAPLLDSHLPRANNPRCPSRVEPGTERSGEMAQRPTVDWNKLPAATKILLVAGLLYFIDLFLPWYKYSVPGHGLGTVSGWHGALGVLCGIVVILILLMETLTVMNIPVNIGTAVMRNQVE